MLETSSLEKGAFQHSEIRRTWEWHVRSEEAGLEQRISIDPDFLSSPLSCIHDRLVLLRLTKRSMHRAWNFITAVLRLHFKPGASGAHIVIQFILRSL